MGLVSKAALEHSGATDDPIMVQPRGSRKIATHPEVLQDTGVEDPVDDILQDAKLYQDAAIEYCNAYQALEQKYSEQVQLMEEASGALLTAESQASQKQQELIDLQKKHKADIQLAVGKAAVQYEEQLSSVTQKLQAKGCAVQTLQDQVCTLETPWPARQTYLL